MKRFSWLVAVAVCGCLFPLIGCDNKKADYSTVAVEADPNAVKKEDQKAKMILPPPPIKKPGAENP